MSRIVMACGLVFALGLGAGGSAGQADTGKVEITVTDKATGKAIPCRIHLKDAAGKGQRAGKLPFWNDHFVCPGTMKVEVPAGQYTIDVDRGPEYSLHTEAFAVDAGGVKKLDVQLQRLVDMPAEGWWPGDLHVHRPVSEVELLMAAEDLHIAPVITWWNKQNPWAKEKAPDDPLVRFDGNRYYHVMAGEDEREGGALLYFHLKRPLDITAATREYPSPLKFAEEARKTKGVWIDAEKPFWWDVPVWVAAGQVDSIGLANNHMCRDRMYEDEAWGKPRLTTRLPAPLGNGYWTQEIYYHLLNCGLRIPPSAGSASGVLPNPVGYNRVYVHVGKELTWDKWWEGLRGGRSFVTNGPLLRVKAGGQLPGHVFTAKDGEEVKLELKAEVTSRDKIRFFEVVVDGDVVIRMTPEDFAKAGSLGTVFFKRSGWFLVRAITDNPKTFRFASTAPFYVEVGETKRSVSRASARFFLAWVRERAGRVKIDNPEQLAEVLKHHEAALKFWQDMVTKANVD